MSLRYSGRPTKVDVKYYQGGDPPAAVFEIGAYQVTLLGPTPEYPPELTYVRADRSPSEQPGAVFPNMDVSEGVLRIPVEDIVEQMLTRLEPAEIARALWTKSSAVRDEFMYCMVENYTDGTLDDGQRRQFLRDVKEAVHSAAVGHLAERFADSEYQLAKGVSYWDQIRRVNNYLTHAERLVRQHLGQPTEPTPEQTEVFRLIRVQDESENPIFKIAGLAWNEARDFWRARMAELFPGQEKL